MIKLGTGLGLRDALLVRSPLASKPCYRLTDRDKDYTDLFFNDVLLMLVGMLLVKPGMIPRCFSFTFFPVLVLCLKGTVETDWLMEGLGVRS